MSMIFSALGGGGWGGGVTSFSPIVSSWWYIPYLDLVYGAFKRTSIMAPSLKAST